MSGASADARPVAAPAPLVAASDADAHAAASVSPEAVDHAGTAEAAAEPLDAVPAGEDISISMVAANLVGLALLPAAAVPVALHLWVHGGPGSWVWLVLALPVFLASVAVHEGLHAVGFFLAGARRRDVRFGIDRKTFTPFAGCRIPLRASAYRLAIVLPALVLGVVPLVAGLAAGLFWPTLYGAAMLHAASGDAAALWAMRGVRGGALVVDHPSRVGCLVVEP